jgi:hypothetical protein
VDGPLRPQAEGPPREINPTYPGPDSREKSRPGVKNLQLPTLNNHYIDKDIEWMTTSPGKLCLRHPEFREHHSLSFGGGLDAFT